MFTGLIEGTGKIVQIVPKTKGLILRIESFYPLKNPKEGESIAVDGVCLTALSISEKEFTAHVSPETLEKSTFKFKKVGDLVNLERALRLGDRLGGHLVSGHVDAVGRIYKIEPLKDFYKIFIEIPENLRKYLIPKGSIAIDGISLTINEVLEKGVSLMIIPHTFQVTTLHCKKEGDAVNIEIDMIAKMVYNFTQNYLNSSQKFEHPEDKISLEFLKKTGFL